MKRATRSFAYGNVVIARGFEVEDDHPAVAGREQFFEDVDVKRGRKPTPAAPPVPVVENTNG